MLFVISSVFQGKAEDPEISIQDTMLLSLLKWFKGFFEWVDSPACEKCGKQTSISHMSEDKKLLVYTDRVEVGDIIWLTPRPFILETH